MIFQKHLIGFDKQVLIAGRAEWSFRNNYVGTGPCGTNGKPIDVCGELKRKVSLLW